MTFILLLSNLFILSLSYLKITNLAYNTHYIEDITSLDSQSLPAETDYYIKLPLNLDKNITFYLKMPNDTKLFNIYYYEFSENPTEEEIKNTNFINEKNILEFIDKSGKAYSIYSYIIEPSDKYKVLYFKNNEPLKYLELYASVDYKIIDLGGKENFQFENIKKNTRLYLRINYNKYSGNDFEIKLNFKTSEDNPMIEVDVGSFIFYPKDEEIFQFDANWIKNLPCKNCNTRRNLDRNNLRAINNNYEYIYKMTTEDNIKYLALQIEPSADLETLEVVIEPFPDDGLPSWAISIIVIISFVLIILIMLIMSLSKTGKEALKCCCEISFCCCCVILSSKK